MIYLFDIKEVIYSLFEVQENFNTINQQLEQPREILSDIVLENMVEAYLYVNKLLIDKIDIFSIQNLKYWLEINSIVLCGISPKIRFEHHIYIQQTHDRFYEYIHSILKWYLSHKNKNTFKVAAETYVGILSRPQLFIEGNHRTASLIASYLLLKNYQKPFVLNCDNAIAFFNPSAKIKFSDKRFIDGLFKLPKYKKRFRNFLEKYTSEQYIIEMD